VRRLRGSWGYRLALGAALSLAACTRNELDQAPPEGTPAGMSRAAGADRAPPAVGRAPLTLSPSGAPTPAGRAAQLSERLSRPAAGLLVAIGDMHGDLDAGRRALRLAGAIDAADQWVGGDLVLVQTGDVIDRGDDDRALLDLLERLRPQARAAGGQLIALSGNHELMNVAQDFSYVTHGGMEAFASVGGRAAAFRPGGPYAVLLAERPVVFKVGDTLFVHGGILPKHAQYGLDRMNDEVRAWMLGQRPTPPEIIVVSDGLVWTRAYSFDDHVADCDQLNAALRLLGARRMVVGHTPQLSGITSACDGRVWRIDTGMSRYYGGPVEVLEIRGAAVRARKESRALAN
jgi:hypothetical protein